MFAAVLSFLIIKKVQVFMKILELSRECNGKMLIFSFCVWQFQGMGKYKTIYVFMTQNVFGNNSRIQLADWFFCCFYIGSLSCCRECFCGSLSGCKHVRGGIKFPDNKNTGFHDILELSGVCNDKMLKFICWWLQFQGFGKKKYIYISLFAGILSTLA